MRRPPRRLRARPCRRPRGSPRHRAAPPRPPALVSSSSSWLGETFEPLIDGLAIEERKRDFIRRRWLEQVVWMEDKAGRAKRRYFQLRLTTVVGAVMIPALVSLDFANSDIDTVARIATWLVSLLVA